MDSALPPTIEFPYIPHHCENTDKCTIENFPDWNKIQIWTLTQSVPLSVAAAFYQSWLLFGLVSVFIGRNVAHGELLDKNENGDHILSFIGQDSKLAVLLDQAAPRHVNQPETDRVPEDQYRVQFALYQAITTLEIVQVYLNTTDDGGAGDIWTSEPHKVIFGIDIFIDILFEHVTQCQTLSALFDWRRMNRRSLPTENVVIRRSIWRSGRCHSLARRLQTSASTWHKLLLLPPLPMLQTHAKCSEYECTHNSIVGSNHPLKCKSKGQTKPKSKPSTKHKFLHTDSCSGCKNVQVDSKEIADIIGEGKIPLVEVTFNIEKQPIVTMVKGDLNFRYTAISHVWVGGLGSEDINSLSSCQIQRLWYMVQELPDLRSIDVECIGLTRSDNRCQRFARNVDLIWNRVRSRHKIHLWLDALCIPVGAAFETERTMAIDSMSQIYAGAESVLVLDPHLQQLQDYESSDSLDMHISISPWMARSWPLQEGALASNLRVRLKNETIICTRSQQKVLLSLSSHLTNSVSESRARQNPDFHAVWNALANRSTTKSRDLPATFAALLNLSAGKILGLESAEDQMRAIIARQKVIPFNIMCRSCAQTGGEGGKSTWIPLFPHSSSETGDLNNFYGHLKVADDGLKFGKFTGSQTFGLIITEKSI